MTSSKEFSNILILLLAKSLLLSFMLDLSNIPLSKILVWRSCYLIFSRSEIYVSSFFSYEVLWLFDFRLECGYLGVLEFGWDYFVFFYIFLCWGWLLLICEYYPFEFRFENFIFLHRSNFKHWYTILKSAFFLIV